MTTPDRKKPARGLAVLLASSPRSKPWAPVRRDLQHQACFALALFLILYVTFGGTR